MLEAGVPLTREPVHLAHQRLGLRCASEISCRACKLGRLEADLGRLSDVDAVQNAGVPDEERRVARLVLRPCFQGRGVEGARRLVRSERVGTVAGLMERTPRWRFERRRV